ncbi:annexin A13-like [Acanthaster planci]|uniref:Annexin n=1 Tax=Acanthaster planci TaxID=133434 RepID=A0A8B7YAC8_ACAPL|nr:annexin A13-like [Acanthaster planci]
MAELAEYIIRYRAARAGLALLGTILAKADFDAEQDAQTLKDAMKGFGTDEDAIIELITDRTSEERQHIAWKYKACFGEDLVEDLKRELRGNLETAVEALMLPAPVYDAKTLREAMRGPGTDEKTIIEIMCTRMNEEIEAIKIAYSARYDRNLGEDLYHETSGDFKNLMLSIYACQRDESDEVDEDKAKEEAQELYDAGEDRWGTDESTFNKILATRNFDQLKETFKQYKEIADCDIEESIRDECSGNLRDGYLAIVSRAKSCAEFFADRLYDALKGAGTDDEQLIRCVVTRAEIDMKSVKIAFFLKYGVGLKSFIASDCSGDYAKLLLALVKTDED